MTKDELITMLESRDVTFRHVAIDEIVMSFPSYADMFFAAFHNDDESTVMPHASGCRLCVKAMSVR